MLLLLFLFRVRVYEYVYAIAVHGGLHGYIYDVAAGEQKGRVADDPSDPECTYVVVEACLLAMHTTRFRID